MNKVKAHFQLIVSLIVFVIYLFTMAPSIVQIDSGELAAVQATLGIAHPTGYPLFTILGFIFSNILFPFEAIVVLNLFAAIYCSAAVYFLVKIAYLILSNIVLPKKEKVTKLSNEQKIIISSIIGFSIAFSETFWFQSTSVEVYSLHLLLSSLTVYFVLKAFFCKEIKYWYASAITLTFGFANHMTTILVLPGMAFIFFYSNGFNKRSFVLIAKMFLIFLPLLSLLYAYLPIRALSTPTLNWGNPVNLEDLIRHISGKQYQVWIFSSIDAAIDQLKYFIESFPQELGYLVLIFSIIGLPLLWKYKRPIAIFLLINFFSTIIYSINYDIADIDAYFLLAYVSFTFFSIGFLVFAIRKIKGKTIYSLLVIPLVPLLINFSKADQSSTHVFEDYTKEILNNVENKSVVFTYLWDYFVSPSYYIQFVENYREDVSIIDKELLRRSWYITQLRNNIPNIVKGAEPQINSFLKALEPFENGNEFDPQLIEKHYRAMMTALVESNINERDFYITPELYENEMRRGEFHLPEGYTIVPMELCLKVVKNTTKYIEANPLDINIRYNKIDNYYQRQIRGFVSRMMIYRILYELQFNQAKKASKIFNRLKANYPEIRVPPVIKERLGK